MSDNDAVREAPLATHQPLVAELRAEFERRIDYVRPLAVGGVSLDSAQIAISEVALRRGDCYPPPVGDVFRWLHYSERFGQPFGMSDVWVQFNFPSVVTEAER